MNLLIRKETTADIKKISEVTMAAFKDHPFSNNTEHFIIQALRNAEVLTISLVAEHRGEIVGHIAFSPVTISDGSTKWYGLGPVAVLPGYQKQGIGKALVHEGLSRLKTLGCKGCVLVGDPAYYSRFGFRNSPELVYEGISQEYVLVLPFDKKTPQGKIIFHQGFSAAPPNVIPPK
jgi:putative acetyltransferase